MSPLAVSTLPPAVALPPVVVRLLSSAPAGWQEYTVRAGDTLVDIAARLGTAPSVIAAQNQLPNGGRLIRVGSVLLVPGKAGASVNGPAAPAAAASTAFTSYTVQRGDTLSHIALRTTATSRQIMAANGLGPSSILRPGQVLRIPGTSTAAPTASPSTPAPAPPPGPAATTAKPTTVTSTAYQVSRGDTIERIASRTGASQASLIKANGLTAPYLIKVGQVLQVPQVAPAASPTPSAANTFAGRTYPQSTVDRATASRAAIKKAGAPSRQEMRSIIEATAVRYGVDPKLALAVGYQESGWDHRQVSVANAIGAMQVIPSSGQWASSLVGQQLDLIQARDNATAGVVILRALTRSTTSLDEAIAGYYQGLTSVKTKGMYSDTERYVANVKALMAKF